MTGWINYSELFTGLERREVKKTIKQKNNTKEYLFLNLDRERIESTEFRHYPILHFVY